MLVINFNEESLPCRIECRSYLRITEIQRSRTTTKILYENYLPQKKYLWSRDKYNSLKTSIRLICDISPCLWQGPPSGLEESRERGRGWEVGSSPHLCSLQQQGTLLGSPVMSPGTGLGCLLHLLPLSPLSPCFTLITSDCCWRETKWQCI